jgi:hypothetical protein
MGLWDSPDPEGFWKKDLGSVAVSREDYSYDTTESIHRRLAAGWDSRFRQRSGSQRGTGGLNPWKLARLVGWVLTKRFGGEFGACPLQANHDLKT